MARRILILVGHWKPHDAVGTDVLGTRRFLEAAGFTVGVAVNSADQALAAEVLDDPGPWLRDRSCAVIYHHTWIWPAGCELFQAARGRRILRYHGSPNPHRHRDFPGVHMEQLEAYWALGPELVSLADAFWPVSTFTGQRLWRWGAPRGRIVVVPPVHRLDDLMAEPVIAPAAPTTASPVVLTVARIAAQKGHVAALQAIKAYVDAHGRGIRFRFVGGHAPDGTADRIHAESERLGLRDIIELPGELDLAGIRAAYEQATVVWVTSQSEGFCLPVLEAQACRRAVLAHPVDAIPETMGPGGLLADPRAPEETAASLARLLCDAQLRTGLIEAGNANLGRFSPERLSQTLLAATKSARTAGTGRIRRPGPRRWRDGLIRRWRAGREAPARFRD